MKNFEDLSLSPVLLDSLARMNYTTPTPIQEKAIPLALKGRDILGSAQTGTGKTAAFSIPLVEGLMTSPEGSALVLMPTRELAKQVLDVIHQLLGPKNPIKTAFIIGGEPMGKQYNQLRANPRIIVGTPGRVNDHLERGSLKLHDTGFLVLDETDKMLDMGFGIQLDKILKFLPENRQTLMFSATLPEGIIRLSSKYLSNPERVSVGATNVIALNIKQEVIRIEQNHKYEELVSQLHERSGSVIVFAKTKHSADKIAKSLRQDGFTADALHGDLRQIKRDKVMNNFRNKIFRILIATDIAARGLDVPHIEHVINYDLPQVAEDYIHRMGRTARAGAAGSALCFISSQDGRKWHMIERLLNPNAASSQDNNDRHKNGKKSGGRNKRGFGKKDNAYDSFRSKNFADRKKSNGFGKRNAADSSNDRNESRSDSDRSEGRSFAKKDGPYKGKPNSDRSEGKTFAKKDGPYKGKPNSNRSEGKTFAKKDGPYKGKPNSNRSEGKTFAKKDGPYKGKSDNGKNNRTHQKPTGKKPFKGNAPRRRAA